MVEDGQSEGLALSVCAQVRLEAKRVDGRDEGLDGVERRARDGSVLGDVTPEGRRTTQDHNSECSSQPRSHIINHRLYMYLALCLQPSAKNMVSGLCDITKGEFPKRVLKVEQAE